MIMLVLGLGNIGAKYENTRHNLGFDLVRNVARRLRTKDEQSRSYCVIQSVQLGLTKVTLALPTTFMNRSGLAAGQMLRELSLEPESMLVVVDDFNLPLGAIRLRPSGSDGGHNGLASISESLGTENFPRMRLGSGPVPDNVSTVDFVLERFDVDQLLIKNKMITTAVEAVEDRKSVV